VVRALRGRARALGVTRVARVTGLDRSGVEVACAVRPLGHVLQVCNGKGATFEQAALSALSEAAELDAAEHPDPLRLRYASVRDLRGRARFVSPDACGELVAPELFTDRTRLGWVEGRSLKTGAAVLVPAQAVFCPPADGPQLGPSLLRWTTNGLAAHVTRARAVRHALLEVMERGALPDGWTEAMVRRRMVEAEGAPAKLARSMNARRLELFLFDLTLEGRGLPAEVRGATTGRVGRATPGRRPPRPSVPLAGALLFDAEGGPIPLTAGYACRPRLPEALLAAAQEAAQSRLTDIHGAREDVAPMDPAGAARLLRACRAARPRRASRAPVTDLLSCLKGDAIVVDLEARGGLRVVKVIAPGLRVSHLL
jgi:ribosomal protein S12 methylthiotransferase accessory factor